MRNPLVSILIPSFNRPLLICKALESALVQTYPNIEIVVCDDSTDGNVRKALDLYIRRDPRIRYFKNEKVLFLENWRRCLMRARGYFINFLMDDDLFQTRKIEKMANVLMSNEQISLVTSYRLLIDEKNLELPPTTSTMRLFSNSRIMEGKVLVNYAFTHARNVIGEPTTVMFRKKDLSEPFGFYHGKQYACLNDMATWTSLLAKGKVFYFAEPLSYFRMHREQGRTNFSLISKSITEWSRLIHDASKGGFLRDRDMYKASIYQQQNYLSYIRTSAQYAPYFREIDRVMDFNEKRLNRPESGWLT